MRACARYLGPDLAYSTLNRHPFGYDAFSTAAILKASSSAGPFFAFISMAGFYRRVPNMLRRRSSNDRSRSSSGMSTASASSRIPTAPSIFSGTKSPFAQFTYYAEDIVSILRENWYNQNMNLEKEFVSTPKDEIYVKYEALRKEIDDMLSVLPGEWLVEEIHLGFDLANGDRWYSSVMSADRIVLLASGTGREKAEALEKILENWRTGMSEPYAPAAGSAEELRLKLAVQKG